MRRATQLTRWARRSKPDFYPRSPCGERHVPLAVPDLGKRFLSTLSLRRATIARDIVLPYILLFLSTLSLRRATTDNNSGRGNTIFLSTLSLRRATRKQHHQNRLSHFYPRSPCGERPTYFDTSSMDDFISIHALLAESDSTVSDAIQRASISIHALLAESDLRVAVPQHVVVISIHALLAESDKVPPDNAACRPPFLSTLSLRRAT